MAALLVLLHVPASDAAQWLCEGDPLSAERLGLGLEAMGPLAAPIPNSVNGTIPGDALLIRWRGITLQLPRTNNAGVASYTDGRWWWRELDSERPEFQQRRGAVEHYSCEPMA
jgi:hypothetical protein